MDKINWIKSPLEPSISGEEVHIYYVSISSVENQIPILKNYLTDEEEKKIMKFIFEKDRKCHMISRSVLKDILSRYLSIKAEDVIFTYNDYGKPFLGNKINNAEINFNLSHSGDMIIYAFSTGRSIGVDVQEIRNMDSTDDIFKRYFSDYENSIFDTLPVELKTGAFYSCWTRKEAYVKAHGSGLSFPLDKFSVSFLPGKDAELLHDEFNDVSGWTLKEIFSSPDYTAALAVEGNNIKYRYYKWSCRD